MNEAGEFLDAATYEKWLGPEWRAVTIATGDRTFEDDLARPVFKETAKRVKSMLGVLETVTEPAIANAALSLLMAAAADAVDFVRTHFLRVSREGNFDSLIPETLAELARLAEGMRATASSVAERSGPASSESAAKEGVGNA